MHTSTRRRRPLTVRIAPAIARIAIMAAVPVVAGCADRSVSPPATPSTATADPLLGGFRQPPHAARPQVWWHWMNGNIDADQAVADLRWAAEQGIGGVHVFEGGLNAPQVVDRRLVYMSPEWQAAFRTSAATAQQLGLDFSIATSPGWSATGGPWVTPDAAMKKLVWSDTIVQGGAQGIRLAAPSSVAGPYQDVPADEPAPSFYRDVAVVAFPARDLPARFSATMHSPVDTALLQDGRFGPTVHLLPDSGGKATITYHALRPTLVGAVQLGLPAPHGFGAPPPPIAELQTSENGRDWRDLVTIPATTAPARTAAFTPVRSRWFRLVLSAAKDAGLLASLPHEPGATPMTPPPPPPGFSISEFRLFGGNRIDAAEAKAGFAAIRDYHAAGAIRSEGVAAASVIDLSARLRSDGTLDWTPPPGRWTILRFGMSLTGRMNGPAPAEATGLEVDKLSADHVSAYLSRYLGAYDKALGGVGTLNGLLSDSIEAGTQNWTDAMPAEFAARRGYSIARFFPALAGYLVCDAGTSDRFLYDFRRTVSDLVSEAHYGTIARIAKSRGQTYYAEALEDHRPQLGDDLAMRAHADVPSGAMWFFEPGDRPRPTYDADLRGAASVAHVTGRPIVGVEALTSFGYPWVLTPGRMRAAADAAFLDGGNRLMLHSMVHQAAGNRLLPGMVLLPSLGHNFNRNAIWAPLARGWIDYIARSQFLLQQGSPQSDFAYFIGEDAPVTGLFGDAEPASIPQGMSYDYLDPALLAELAPVAGKLRNRSGNDYGLLFLGGSSRRMTGATLARLESLAKSGVVIAGPPPVASPSLADHPADFADRVAALWRRSNVFNVASPQEAAARLGLLPAWRYTGTGTVEALHRTLDDADLFYVVNRSARPAKGQLSVNADRALAQWWDPVTNTIEGAERSGDGKRFAVDLLPNESRFLLLRSHGVRAVLYGPPKPIAEAGGGWSVDLASRDNPATHLDLASLMSLDRSDDPAMRAFSGIATYRSRVDLPRSAGCAGRRLWLYVDSVGDVGRVTVNGTEAGYLWTEPYRVDVTGFVRRGANDLAIQVANTWKNRLVAEARSGNADAQRYYRPDAPLSPAGLSGAVRLMEQCPR